MKIALVSDDNHIPIINDIEDIDSAVQAILNDTIINHTEKLH